MLVGMIGIEANENTLPLGNLIINLLDSIRVNARPLNHADTIRHRMRFNSRAIMRPNVDIHADDTALPLARIDDFSALRRIGVIKKSKDRCAQDERSPMRNTR